MLYSCTHVASLGVKGLTDPPTCLFLQHSQNTVRMLLDLSTTNRTNLCMIQLSNAKHFHQDLKSHLFTRHIMEYYCTLQISWFKKCRPSGYWYSTFRPHNAIAPSATLATSTPARWLQGCDARSSVVVWHFTIVPSWRPPSCRRCSWVTTMFHSKPNMRCDVDIWHLQR